MDSSVYDSRIAETTKDHVFLGMACEDGEGQSIGVNSSFLVVSLSNPKKLLLVLKNRKKEVIHTINTLCGGSGIPCVC